MWALAWLDDGGVQLDDRAGFTSTGLTFAGVLIADHLDELALGQPLPEVLRALVKGEYGVPGRDTSLIPYSERKRGDQAAGAGRAKGGEPSQPAAEFQPLRFRLLDSLGVRVNSGDDGPIIVCMVRHGGCVCCTIRPLSPSRMSNDGSNGVGSEW